MTKDEALKMAKEFIGGLDLKISKGLEACMVIDEIDKALAQPAQMYQQMPDGTLKALNVFAPSWQGLSREEIRSLDLDNDVISVIFQTEKLLKEKNHVI